MVTWQETCLNMNVQLTTPFFGRWLFLRHPGYAADVVLAVYPRRLRALLVVEQPANSCSRVDQQRIRRS